MPTATTTTATPKTDGAATFVADTAKQSTEQLLGVIRQTSKLSLDTASTWMDAVTKVLPPTPAMPFAPSKAAIQQLVAASFDTAESVLALQRDLTTEFFAKLVPSA
jgi:hypothetical protein